VADDLRLELERLAQRRHVDDVDFRNDGVGMDVVENAAREIVEGDHRVAARNECVDDMRADEPGSSGDDDAAAVTPQYHLPLAKPPNAISPISAMMIPSQTLQTIATTIPMMTRMPPTLSPAISCSFRSMKRSGGGRYPSGLDVHAR
jgi:hypothetical protein